MSAAGLDAHAGARRPCGPGDFAAIGPSPEFVDACRTRVDRAAEMIRVTHPDGILAACVWDSTAMPLLRAFWDARARRPPGAPG